MITKIQSKVLFTIIVVASILISACAPIAPGGYSAPAAGREGRGGGNESAAPAEESASEAPAAASGAVADSAGRGDYRPRSPAPTAALPERSAQYEAVTAGVTDDNEEWQDYLDYLDRNPYIYANQRDVSERYIITVVDEAGATVHDATVQIYANNTEIFSGRTDAGGQVLFHPLALDTSWQVQRSGDVRVVATKGYVARSETFYRHQGERWTITLGEPERLPYAQLDLLFLIDATGSMGDEINKLKATMADIADQIAFLPEQPDVRYSLVAYRDRGDAFVVRSYDFTPNLGEFQRSLSALRADGGGDEPEALNEALHRSIHELSWRSEDTVRLVILVADAPPHLDYRWENFSYDTDMIEAVRQGIKIFPVGASNLNAEGEYIFRQLAQFTGGKFVFLTYADGSNPGSGPGTETEHDVDNYSVDTLDRLVVRLVRDELAKLGGEPSDSGTVGRSDSGQSGSGTVGQQPPPTATPMPPRVPVSCTIQGTWRDCGSEAATAQLIGLVGRGLYEVNLNAQQHGYDRVRFDITYGDAPSGFSVDIGDAEYTYGVTPDSAHPVNTAEVQVVDDELFVFANRTIPAEETLDWQRNLLWLPSVVKAGETLSIEISDGRVGINAPGGIEVVNSPHLFQLAGRLDEQGQPDDTIYVAFNRSIDGNEYGAGVGEVVVTFYPTR